MSAQSSDSPAPTRDHGTADPPGDRTAAVAPAASEHLTRSFGGPDGTAAFPDADDRYVLLAFLARGGMGEVWTARDRVLNREVALKLLREDFRARAPSASRFVDEARITGRLQHPGIPPVHDLGTLRDGRPFIAMKLIRGRTLADLLAHARPGVADLLRVFEDVCQAVAYAHDRRVIHRDLKPANVMVGAFNEVQVMDWGLAKALGEAPPPAPDAPPPGDAPAASVIESDRDPSSHTRAGSLLGTPAYMPPEQAKGDIDRTDARSDVFALGAVLCELLTGRPPYAAETAAEVLALAITAQLGPAFERLDAAGADPELVALAKRCLRANPADRPADAKQVAAAVAAFRAGVEGRLRAAERERAAAEARAAEEVNTRREAEARFAEHRKRRHTQQALAAAAVVILAGVAGGAWWADRQAAERDRVRRAAQAEVDRLEDQRRADARQKQSEDDGRVARNTEAIELLLADVNAALVADDAETAAVPFGLVEKRFAEGAAAAVAARVSRARADLAVLRALDRADELMWTAEDYKLRVRRSTEAWEAAFKDYGIDVADAAAAARAVRDSPVRDRLLLALDLLLLNHPERDRQLQLRDLLRAADPDPYRDSFRNTRIYFDLRTKLGLLDDPAILRQPPRFAAVIGLVHQFPAEHRERVVRPVLERTPDNFTLINTMLSILESGSSVRTETIPQQLRWAQAGVSVRPTNKVAWRNLGRAQWTGGRIDEATRCFRRAVQLDPRDYNSWTQLSSAFLAKNDPEAALEAADRALTLNPDYPFAINARGAVFQRVGRHAEALAAFDAAIAAGERTGWESSGPFNNRGFTHLRLGDYNAAIHDFKEALRISPDLSTAERNLTHALRQRRTGVVEPQLAPEPRERKP